VLDMSRYLADFLPAEKKPIDTTLDLLPNLEPSALNNKMTELLKSNPKKKVVNIITEFVSKRIGIFLYKQAGCDEGLAAGQLTKDVRKKLITAIKSQPLSIVRTRDISEATVTRGGINLKEIDSKTMESKICPYLFFAGEILDVDGPCGGYNLQICFSTAVLAGSSAAQKHTN